MLLWITGVEYRVLWMLSGVWFVSMRGFELDLFIIKKKSCTHTHTHTQQKQEQNTFVARLAFMSSISAIISSTAKGSASPSSTAMAFERLVPWHRMIG